jgi:YVTN family beta-propeller protein
VTGNGTGEVTELNPDGSKAGTFSVGISPDGIALDGTRMWVANATSNTVSVLNLDGSVATTFSVGTAPYGLAWDGAAMWVTNQGSGNVTKIG